MKWFKPKEKTWRKGDLIIHIENRLTNTAVYARTIESYLQAELESVNKTEEEKGQDRGSTDANVEDTLTRRTERIP